MLLDIRNFAALELVIVVTPLNVQPPLGESFVFPFLDNEVVPLKVPPSVYNLGDDVVRFPLKIFPSLNLKRADPVNVMT